MSTIEHFDHSYGGREVFCDARIELPETGAVALRGPNGCGKTTLLKILGGVIRSSCHEALHWRETHQAVYLDAEFLTLTHLSVREALEAVAPILRSDAAGGADRELIDDSMWGTRLGGLSLGQRQRLVLTIALGMPEERALLLDEPLNGLDSRGRQRARELILNRRGLVLLATHETDHWTEFELVIETGSSCRLMKSAVAG